MKPFSIIIIYVCYWKKKNIESSHDFGHTITTDNCEPDLSGGKWDDAGNESERDRETPLARVCKYISIGYQCMGDLLCGCIPGSIVAVPVTIVGWQSSQGLLELGIFLLHLQENKGNIWIYRHSLSLQYK